MYLTRGRAPNWSGSGARSRSESGVRWPTIKCWQCSSQAWPLLPGGHTWKCLIRNYAWVLEMLAIPGPMIHGMSDTGHCKILSRHSNRSSNFNKRKSDTFFILTNWNWMLPGQKFLTVRALSGPLKRGVRDSGFKPLNRPEIQYSNFKQARIRDSNFMSHTCVHIRVLTLRW